MGSVARANDDFDIAVELCHEMQPPLRGKAVELVVFEFRDMGLGDAEQRRRCGLRSAASV